MHGNVLLGPPRLRQIRVKKGQCKYHPVFSKYLPECYSPYTWLTENRDEYKGIKWQSMSKAGATPLWGEFEIYSGAGYITNFSYDNEENIQLVKKLRQENWINHGTRLLLLEFSLYHVNTRLFELVKFMVEIPPTGSCIPMVKLRTLRRESFINNPSWLMSFITFAYYVFICSSSYREIFLINAMGFCNYIRVMINLADFSCCLVIEIIN
ncbi:polycystic kidney disease 2-like 1 protein [Drosophila innubila]|uniref:polycystic kidney disease 2-like 1 protein n=1 Tax=Drosophila innubila TaxID=198719 RepID=UPI00148E4A03|nr:polycystic kidney disease 2-like 1 protein [Drosophila innubila]